MPVTNVEVISNQIYRVCVEYNPTVFENVLISSNGIYSILYNRQNKTYNKTGKIRGIAYDAKSPRNTFILFDQDGDDFSTKRERIFMSQIQFIKDITPNNAYVIAVKHGFSGNETEWLASLQGADGKSAYTVAVEEGFLGTKAEWLDSLKGKDGLSAYELAVKDYGYTGTKDEWYAKNGDTVALEAQIQEVQTKLNWVEGMASSTT